MINPEIQKRLINLQVGGCTCMTKTPDIQYHNERCTYRLATEIERLLLEQNQGMKLVGYMNSSGNYMSVARRERIMGYLDQGGEFAIAARMAERHTIPVFIPT